MVKKIRSIKDVSKLKYERRLLSFEDFDVLDADKDFEVEIANIRAKIKNIDMKIPLLDNKIEESKIDVDLGVIKNASNELRELRMLRDVLPENKAILEKELGEMALAKTNKNAIVSGVKNFILANNFVYGISVGSECILKETDVPKEIHAAVKAAKIQKMAIRRITRVMGLSDL